MFRAHTYPCAPRSIGTGAFGGGTCFITAETFGKISSSSGRGGGRGGGGRPSHYRARSRSRSAVRSRSGHSGTLPPVFSAFPPVRRPTAAEGDRKGTGKGDKGTLPREERPEPDPEPQPGEDLDVRAEYLELINLWWVLRNQNPGAALLAWNFLVDNAPAHILPPTVGQRTATSTSRRV